MHENPACYTCSPTNAVVCIAKTSQSRTLIQSPQDACLLASYSDVKLQGTAIIWKTKQTVNNSDRNMEI